MLRQPTTHTILLHNVDTTDSYGRSVVEGIIDFAREHGPWSFIRTGERTPLENHTAELRLADAVIIRPGRDDDEEFIANLEKPAVVLLRSPTMPIRGLPLVTDDEPAMARMAFEHLRGTGVDHMAFVDHLRPASERSIAFADCVVRAGLEHHSYPPAPYQISGDWYDRLQELSGWLGSLPTPLGIFCFSIQQARDVMLACQRVGLAVPEQAAVLTCGGDDVECHLCTPPLSALDQGGERIGWQGAQVLNDLLHERTPRRQVVSMPPTGIVRRQSTDLLAVDDPDVEAAIRFIRSHAGEPIHVEDVLERLQRSRRHVEQAFRRTLGRTIYQQIVFERVERAKRLLIRTGHPLSEIATQCGFAVPPRLSEVFKRETGVTPIEFRRRFGRRPKG